MTFHLDNHASNKPVESPSSFINLQMGNAPSSFSNKNDLPAIAFLTIFLIIYFYPTLFQNQSFFFRDIISYFYPLKNFIWQTWRTGALPNWNPNIFNGIPFMALLHTSPFYPPGLIFLLNDFSIAFNLYIFSHFLFLATSVYLLLRSMGISVIGGLCASITAVLSGYFLSISSIYNHFQSATWLPIIFFFFRYFLLHGEKKYYFGVVFCVSCQTLAGSPENSLLTIFLLWFFSLFLVADTACMVRGPIKKTWSLGIIVLFSLGISAIQLIPTYYLLDSMDRGKGLIYEQATHWSFSLDKLNDFILPANQEGFMESYLGGMDYFLQSYYMGLLPLLLMLAGLFKIFNSKEIRFWTIAVFVGIFFSLGKWNPFYHFIFDWVPFVDMFRYPEKYLILTIYSFVFITGYGVDILVAQISNNKSFGKKVLSVNFAMSCILVGIALIKPGINLLESFLILMFLGIAIAGLMFGKIRPILFKVCLLVFILIDLIIKNFSLTPLIENRFFLEPPELAKQIIMDPKDYRVFSGTLSGANLPKLNNLGDSTNIISVYLNVKERLLPNLSTIYGMQYANGQTGLSLKDHRLWKDIFNKSPEEKRVRMLKRSNVKYWVTDQNEIGPSEKYPFGKRKVKVFEDALPRAFIVPNAKLGKEPHLLNLYYDKAFDPLKEVLVGEAIDWNLQENFQGQVNGIDYYPNGVTLQTEQNGDGFLVLLDSYFPGWSVKIDGKEDHIYRANYFFRAVKLGPGDHTVEFSFEPVGFRAGCWVSASTLLILISILIIPSFRKIILPAVKPTAA